MLFGLAIRTAQQIEKVSLFYELVVREGGRRRPAQRDALSPRLQHFVDAVWADKGHLSDNTRSAPRVVRPQEQGRRTRPHERAGGAGVSSPVNRLAWSGGALFFLMADFPRNRKVTASTGPNCDICWRSAASLPADKAAPTAR